VDRIERNKSCNFWILFLKEIMRKLILILCFVILSISLVTSQTKTGGRAKVGGTAKVGRAAAAGGGGWTLISSVEGLSVGGNTITTSAINTTGADLIVIVALWYDLPMDASGFSDNQTNSYFLSSTSSPVVGSRCAIAYVYAPAVSSSHTFTFNATGGAPTIFVMAFSGALADVIDQQNVSGHSGSGTTSPPQVTGSITPSVNNSLIITGIATVADSGGHTVASPFILSNQANGVSGNSMAGGAAYYIQPTAGAITASWSWSDTAGVATIIASFKPE
jgi:hypothetical protein